MASTNKVKIALQGISRTNGAVAMGLNDSMRPRTPPILSLTDAVKKFWAL